MSSPQSITHISSAGERWDLLAWTFYGDPTQLGPLVMANPGVPIEPVLEAGLTIIIPILQKTNVVSANLPPWKRASS